MEQDFGFWSYPVFNVVNYVLSAVAWTCVGRFFLGLFLPPDSGNYIWRWFRRLTDWAVDLVRYITPGFMVEGFMPLVAAFWLFVAKYVFWRVMALNGWAPTLVGSGLG